MEAPSKIIQAIYKEAGKSDEIQTVTDWLTTGFIPLNKNMSGNNNDGFPVGRITEVAGMESTGKTLLATMGMVNTQHKGGLAIFVDYEHSFDVRFAQKLGLITDPNHWIYWQPTTAEDGFKKVDFVCEIMQKESYDKPVTVVMDSVASMLTEEEMKAGHEPNMRTRLSLASCLSNSLKQMVPKINKANIALILLNQLRTNPTIKFGDADQSAGGNALKFYASCRIRLRKSGTVKDDEDEKVIIGEQVTAKLVKNKVGGTPFSECKWVTGFGLGINLPISHIMALEEAGKFGDTKGWIEWEGKKMRRKQLIELVSSNPAEYDKMLSLFE